MARTRLAPTIQDVASAAGVSVSTVSRVLNDKDDVAPKTAARVRQVIDSLGYHASLAARSMRSRQTGVVGLVVDNVTSAFFLEAVKGVRRAIGELGLDLFIFTSGRQADSIAQADWERRKVSLLNGGLADGVLVFVPVASTFPAAVPLVAVDPHKDGLDVPSVISTNKAGALAAMSHLLELGHRRIGYVGGREDLQSGLRRRQGYEEALRRAGLALDPALVQPGDFRQESGARAAHTLLSLSDRPTAIFAANDESAFGVLESAAALGISVPGELSVVGFDNVPASRYCEPPLTTVDQAIEEMGYLAAGLLVKLMQGGEVSVRPRRVPTELVARASTGPPA